MTGQEREEVSVGDVAQDGPTLEQGLEHNVGGVVCERGGGYGYQPLCTHTQTSRHSPLTVLIMTGVTPSTSSSALLR